MSQALGAHRLASLALRAGRGSLDWDRDGGDWPNREASRFVHSGGLRWHVQQLGRGPAVLLVHGTGGATHSWRGLAPRLARRFRVVAPDLPGHGFTTGPATGARSLPGMAELLGELLHDLDVRPSLVVGHSAGAAIACRMTLDGEIAPRVVVSLNGAFLPLDGLVGRVSSPLAKLMVLNPLVPPWFAWRASDPRFVTRLLRSTGSRIDEDGLRLYGLLLRSRPHVAAALGMMARWDLTSLVRELGGLGAPLVLVVAEGDRFVAPDDARRVRERLPAAELVSLPGLGHLAHEERPDEIAELVFERARRVGIEPAEEARGA